MAARGAPLMNRVSFEAQMSSPGPAATVFKKLDGARAGRKARAAAGGLKAASWPLPTGRFVRQYQPMGSLGVTL
jgi:hypothetical protein